MLAADRTLRPGIPLRQLSEGKLISCWADEQTTTASTTDAS
jgi:hypothetical protein